DTDADTDVHSGAGLLDPVYVGKCDVDVSGATELANRLIFQDLVGDPKWRMTDGPVIVPLPTLAAYAFFAVGTGIEDLLDPYAIDFDTEYAFAITYAPGPSCGVSLGSVDTWDVDGIVHVAARLIDDSYGCEETACGSPRGVAIFAMPHGSMEWTDPTTLPMTGCLGVGGGCGKDPR
ncbi:MAG: hypothetical protein KC621_00640, partial [Myxococcales bacterium]|nr:hypothetical protein [Myxococcales bacterium]